MKICGRCFAVFGDDVLACDSHGAELFPIGEGDPLLGSVIADNRVLLLDLLGRGGTSRVYRAVQLSVGRQIALKLLDKSGSEDAEFFERFEREARMTARLRSPYTVLVHDYGPIGD